MFLRDKLARCLQVIKIVRMVEWHTRLPVKQVPFGACGFESRCDNTLDRKPVKFKIKQVLL